MKKVLLAMAFVGLTQLNAKAQTTVCSVFDQNFKVCENRGGYYVCGDLPAGCNTTVSNVNLTEKPMQEEQNPGKHSKYDINYKVCLNNKGYTICDEDCDKGNTQQQPTANAPTGEENEDNTPDNNLNQ